MPDTFSALDQNLPRFTGGETVERKVQVIQDYLYQLLEALRYAMYNLDTSNFNQTEWDKFLDGYGSGLTDPIYKQLSDAEGNLTNLELTAKGLQLQITNNAGDIHNLSITAEELKSDIQSADGKLSSILQTAEKISTQVSDAQKNISSMEQTAKEIKTSVSNAEGDISIMRQTANSISTTIQNAQNDISSMRQTANSISTTIQNAQNDISSMRQTADSISTTIQNAEGYISSMKQTAEGFVNTVIGPDGRLSKVEQTVNGLGVYNPITGKTIIDGGNIDTVNLKLDSLYGNVIYFKNPLGNVAGQIFVDTAATADYAVELNARAMRLYAAGGDLYLRASNGFVTLYGGSGNTCIGWFAPNQSGMYSCGTSWRTWSDVYANNSVIQTSDREAKEDISYGLDRYNALFDALRPASFRFRDGTSGRTHLGMIAQDVEAALEETGLTDMDFAGFIRSAPPDAEGAVTYGLRYGEFIAMLIYQVQKLKARVDALEGKETA